MSYRIDGATGGTNADSCLFNVNHWLTLPFSVSVWFKRASDTGWLESLFSNTSINSESNAVWLYLQTDNALRAISAPTSSGYGNATSGTITVDGNWHIGIGEWGGSGSTNNSRRAALDYRSGGGSISTDETSSWSRGSDPGDGNTAFVLGRGNKGSNYDQPSVNASSRRQFDGYIAEVAVWNTILSDTEKYELYTKKPSACTFYATKCVNYWALDSSGALTDAVGSVVLTAHGNASYNADHPTLSGGASAVVSKLALLGVG